MCYYNGQRVIKEEYIRLKELEKLVSRYDFLSHELQIGFDYGPNAVLRAHPDHRDFDLVTMEWGFIPHYLKTRESVAKMRNGYKDEQGRFHPPILTLNAVCEEILLPGKIYRKAVLSHRCLVLSSGFYEWRHLYPLNKKTGQPTKTARKIPYYVSLKNKSYFFMAGVWQPWTDQVTGEYVESFAIVTTRANPLLEQIHNSKKRMPVILDEDLAYEWLLGNPDEKRIAEIACKGITPELMEAHTIAKDFRESGEPSREFVYEDVPPLNLNF
ncbi:MAG: SOS response-associated peptidase [Bacteroidota bacterium]|nr:SOS response-associated peptidase [Bacteroidota bacterium]